MPAWPRLSIVTPTRNQAHFLPRTLDSVLSQGYPNLEYIIIDGNSTDNTVAIIKKHAKHLAHWESGPDRGPWDALNKGFRQVTGDIVAWINSDDCYAENAFATVGRFFAAHPEVFFVHGQNREVDESGNALSRHPSGQTCWEKIIFGGEILNQETCFWRRTLLPNPLFSGTYPGAPDNRLLAFDYDLWIRILRHVRPVFLDVHLANFRVHGAQITRDWEEYVVDMRRCRDRHLKRMRYARRTARAQIELWTGMVRRETCRRARQLGLSSYFLQPDAIWRQGWPFQGVDEEGSPPFLDAEYQMQASSLVGALIRRRIGSRRDVVLFGAGQHTRRLLRWTDLPPLSIVAILDDGAEVDEIQGIPVLKPADYPDKDVPLIISSDAKERTLCRRARELGFSNIVTLYEET
ncbi:MAG: glycosyltransferase [Kiritimatiellae bacterium]|nr:glycosyltransferase [Kiritimatiellia bacterium]